MITPTRIECASQALLGVLALFVIFWSGCSSDGSKESIDVAPVDAASLDASAEIIADASGPKETTADSAATDTPESETTPDDAVPDAAGSGLPGGIFELAGFDPSLPLDDLAPLGGIIGEAHMVAMGESMHTSKGYYQAKHRLFKYLVEEKGFRVLAFESNWTPAQNIEAYVQTCAGDPGQLVVDNLLYTWTGQSVADLIEWMCKYNQTHPDDPVHFFGFDIQQTWLDGPALMAFLDLVAPDMAEEFNAGIAKCRCTTSPSHADCVALYGELGPVSDEELDACTGALEVVGTWLDEHTTEAILASSNEELEFARMHLEGIEKNSVKNYHKMKNQVGQGYDARDWGMAYVFNKIRSMKFPDKKVAIWAHNWHIAHQTPLMKEPLVVMAPVPIGLQAATGMGTLLRQQFGADYLAIGLHAYQVSINWKDLRQGDLQPHVDESLEGLLHALERPALLVDLAFPGAEEPFLDDGASYPVSVFEGVGVGIPIVPAQQYRAILFLDYSPMMDPLSW